MKPSLHIQLKIKGNAQRIEDFNNLLRWVDLDWPYGNGTSRANAGKISMMCKRCGGLVYTHPVFGQDQIRAAAIQCGVGVKFRRWEPGSKCGFLTQDPVSC